jgi:hypothetical protein
VGFRGKGERGKAREEKGGGDEEDEKQEDREWRKGGR